MSEDLPVVSIIMPCFNAAAHLPASVGSVLQQTFKHWELIVVDDGSIDDSLAWLQAVNDRRVKLRHQSNQGVSVARNRGLALARAEHVAFLDADDTWAPTFLERMLATLESRHDAVLAYCGWQNLGMTGARGAPFIPPDYETPLKHELLFAGCRWPVHAALSRRSALVATGGFNPSLQNAEDYALWLEMAGTSPIVRVPEVLAFYHFHGKTQASSNRARAALHLLSAKKHYLAQHPQFSSRLSRTRRRELLYTDLLRAGYECYWNDELPAARSIFKRAIYAGFCRPRDWFYIMPCLLPEGIHRYLITSFRRFRS